MHPSYRNVATTNYTQAPSTMRASQTRWDSLAIWKRCLVSAICRFAVRKTVLRFGGFDHLDIEQIMGDTFQRSQLLYCLQVRKPVYICVLLFGIERLIVWEEMTARFKDYFAPSVLAVMKKTQNLQCMRVCLRARRGVGICLNRNNQKDASSHPSWTTAGHHMCI